MSEFDFITIIIASGFAGLIGALTGLGGGIIIIPCLTLIFHIPIHQAMAAGLIATITTSSGSAATLLEQGFTNLKIGMFLEVGTIIGAFVGALLVAITPIHLLQTLFGAILLSSALLLWRQKNDQIMQKTSDPLAIKLGMPAQLPNSMGNHIYNVCRIKMGFLLMMCAGLLSGLLGIGSGSVKVLAMDQVMRLPYKVATATSNFIIGITAAASIGIYWSHGYVNETTCTPVVLGTLCGSVLGGHFLKKWKTQLLRQIFMILISIIGIQMIYRGIGGLL